MPLFLFYTIRLLVIEHVSLGLAYPLLLLQLHVLLDDVEGDGTVQILPDDRVGKFGDETFLELELRITVLEISQELHGMEE